MSRVKSTAAVIAALMLCGCGNLPKDPEHTSEHVAGGVLRVGVSANPPWTQVGTQGGGAEPSGPEADMVRALAAQQRARVEWKVAGEDALVKDLEKHRLDLIIGGITKDTPWKSHASLTRPFASDHVWLTASGENHWLLTLDRFLRSHELAQAATQG